MRPHGTKARYDKERCRCGPCKNAQNEYRRLRREAMRAPLGTSAVNWSAWTPEELAYLETDEARAFIDQCRGIR